MTTAKWILFFVCGLAAGSLIAFLWLLAPDDPLLYWCSGARVIQHPDGRMGSVPLSQAECEAAAKSAGIQLERR